jgi:hypothetical protein
MVSGIACALWPSFAASVIPAMGDDISWDLVPTSRIVIPHDKLTPMGIQYQIAVAHLAIATVRLLLLKHNVDRD